MERGKGALALLLPLLLAYGCSGARGVKEDLEIYYPPPPQEPKIKFLKSISTSQDIEKGPSWFEKAIVGTKGAKKGMGKPYGVNIYDGKIYICDTMFGTMVVVDLGRQRFDLFPDRGRGKLKKPMHVAIDGDGTKYVADIDRGQIVVFGPDNRFLRAIGSREEMRPTDAVIKGDTLYIADAKDNQIEARDKNTGEVFFTFGEGGNEPGQLLKPTNLALDSQGNLYVTDTINFRVQKFDPNGKLLAVFGKAGDGIGAFTRPKGVDVDREGHIYVVDSAFENIQIFDQTGDVLLFFGGPGRTPGSMYLPADVRIDYDNTEYFESYAGDDFQLEYLILVTNQYGSHKLNIYGFGHPK